VNFEKLSEIPNWKFVESTFLKFHLMF